MKLHLDSETPASKKVARTAIAFPLQGPTVGLWQKSENTALITNEGKISRHNTQRAQFVAHYKEKIMVPYDL